MHILILATLLCAQPNDTVTRVKIETLTLTDAERLTGKTVVTTFTVAKPAFTWGEGQKLVTVIGPADDGGPERTVVLKGNRLLDADRGARVTVVGTLRVIRHPAAVVGGVKVTEWVKVRVTEG